MSHWTCTTHHVTLTVADQHRRLTATFGETQGCALTQNYPESRLRELAHETRTRWVTNTRGERALEQIAEVTGDE